MQVAIAISNTANKNQELLSILRNKNKEESMATLFVFHHTQVSCTFSIFQNYDVMQKKNKN
jgi:hypothetical protein